MDFKDLYNLVHDDFAWFDEWANPVNRSTLTVVGTYPSARSLKLVDLDNYAISPKRSFVERQIKEKEANLQKLKDQKANYLHWSEEQERSLLAEIGNLKTQLGKKIEKE